MKICVITPLFAFSGVPLAQIRFARALASAGHDVDLVLGQINPELNFPDSDNVRLINMNKRNVRSLLFPIMKYLRAEKPDVIFSAEDHLNGITLLAIILTRSKVKFSGSSRVTPFDTYSNTPFTKRWVLKHFMRLVMPRADALTCVSQGTVEEYRKVFRNPRHVCVYNIIDDESSRQRIMETAEHDWFLDNETPVLVAAGMLAPWKGYADLIRALKIINERKAVRLMILGDGPLRAELEELIIDLELSDNVKLLGYVENPLKYFKRADLFVHSSYVESLGNVLVEAMMCGCTPVSTDCPTGPREVLQGGKYGYLAPMKNPIALADVIETALDARIPTELLNEAVQPFSEQAILKRHFEVLGINQAK